MRSVIKAICCTLLVGMAANMPVAHAQSYSLKGLSPQARALIAEIAKFGAGDPSRDPEGDLVKLADLRRRVEADRTVPQEELGNLESAVGAGHFYARRYAKAVEHYEIAARHFEESKAAPSELAGLYANMGTILSSLTRYDEAETYHRRALEIRERLEGKRGPMVASSLFGIGYVYYRTGRIEESIPLLRESVEQQLEFLKPDNPLIVVRMTSLASVLSRSGREAEGLKVARRAEAIGRKHLGEKHPTYAIALHNLGTALIESGHYSEAVPMMREALAVRVATIGETASGTALSLRNLATALKKSGATTEAEELTRKATEIFTKSGETDTPLALATLYYELADFAAMRADWPAYDRLAGQALAEADRKLSASNFERARLHLQHAERLGERGKSGEALAIAEREVPVLQKALIASHADRIWAELLLSRLRQQAAGSAAPSWALSDSAIGRLSGKLANIAVSDRQLVREAATNRKSALLYFETALAVGDQDRAFAALQLVNISDLAIGQQFASDTDSASVSGDAASLRRSLLDLARRLAQTQDRHDLALQAQQTAKVAKLAADVADLEAQVRNAEATLQNRFPDFVLRYRPSPVTLAQFRSSLSDGEVLIAPVEGSRGTTVVSISRQGMAWHKADLDQSVSVLRRAVESPAAGLGQFPFADAEKMYRALFPKGVKRGTHILFHGGGAIASLPLPLLLTRKYQGDLRHAPWLVRQASFQVIGNLALHKPAQAASVGGKDGDVVIGIGGVDLPNAPERRTAISGLFRSGAPEAVSISALPALPNAGRELRAIADALPGENDLLLIGADAQEERVKAADLSKARIIAFATHGLVAGEVRDLWEPALLVGTAGPQSGEDGLLGAHEIAQLKLSAEWVILSACNTSSGDRREGPVYSGLATAFAQAGARALLLSHWQVRDDAAASLSVETVRGAVKGLSRAEALRRAQLALLSNRKVVDSGHPAVWAPFVIVEN